MAMLIGVERRWTLVSKGKAKTLEFERDCEKASLCGDLIGTMFRLAA